MNHKTPSAIRGDSGLLSYSRFARQYCRYCQTDELHHSGVCVQCKRGGIVISPERLSWNGRRK